MGRKKHLDDDPELIALREAERELLLREKECAEIPRKLAQELKDQESIMPPLLEIEERRLLIQHEQTISRGQVTNTLRDQNRSLLLIFMLLAATGSLIWWSLQLMQG